MLPRYVKPVNQCSAVAEKDCHTVPEEKCEWAMESKWLSHPGNTSQLLFSAFLQA
jgi:hypothetical protein